MSTREADISPVASGSGSGLADWAEAVMLVEGVQALGRGELRRRLSVLGTAGDIETELLLQEVRDRARIAPQIYPFRQTETGIAMTVDVEPTVYAFLVLASLEDVPFRESRQFEDADLLFDRVALLALRALLGNDAAAVRFASPPSGDRPAGFRDAIAWLGGHLGLPVGSVAAPPRRKDGGVDVVVWRAFRDGRTAFPVLLAQCTIALDHVHKGADIVVDQWRGWLTFAKDPMTALVVPFAVPHSEVKWDDTMRFHTHIIIDRMRICELLSERGLIDDASLIDGLSAWLYTQKEPLLLTEETGV